MNHSEIRNRAEEELVKRFELYFQNITDEQLIGSGGDIPLWLAVSQFFDIVMNSNRKVELAHQVLNGKIIGVQLVNEVVDPTNKNSEYSKILREMKANLR